MVYFPEGPLLSRTAPGCGRQFSQCSALYSETPPPLLLLCLGTVLVMATPHVAIPHRQRCMKRKIIHLSSGGELCLQFGSIKGFQALNPSPTPAFHRWSQ